MASLRDSFDNRQPEVDSKGSNGQTERISVEMDSSNPAEPKIKLRQQSWANGMGWFTQKTIVTDIANAQELLRDLENALIEAKMTRSQTHHTPNKTTVPPAEDNTSKVIEFPLSRTSQKTYQNSDNPVDNSENKVVSFKPRKRV